jgi:hypothetical protein
MGLIFFVQVCVQITVSILAGTTSLWVTLCSKFLELQDLL